MSTQNLYINVNGIYTCNRQTREASQTSTSVQCMVYIHNPILLSNKNKWSTATTIWREYPIPSAKGKVLDTGGDSGPHTVTIYRHSRISSSSYHYSFSQRHSYSLSTYIQTASAMSSKNSHHFPLLIHPCNFFLQDSVQIRVVELSCTLQYPSHCAHAQIYIHVKMSFQCPILHKPCHPLDIKEQIFQNILSH